ncbi:MAG: hypothetical protein PHS88_10430 [Candidatus Omnitrophica bacterium]|nr:hypothetical protein [Candidatus Omnitrophota bacterium]
MRPIILLILCLLIVSIPAMSRAEQPREKWVDDKEPMSKLAQAERYANIMLLKEKRPAPAKPKRWLLFGKTGFEFDDNVPLLTNMKQYRDGAQDTKAARFTISPGVAYEFYRDASRKAGVSYQYSHYLHSNDMDQYNFQNHQVTVYGTQNMTAWDRPAQLRLNYAFALGVLNRNTYSSSNVWNGAWTGEYADNLLVTVYQGLGSINFRDKGFDKNFSSRDGFYGQTGVVQTFLFGQRRRSLSFGYELAVEDTRGKDFKALMNGARVRLVTPVIEKVMFESSFYFQVADYRHFSIHPNRLDFRYQYEFLLSRPITRNIKATVYYKRTDVHDAHAGVLPQFNYSRNIEGMELTYAF